MTDIRILSIIIIFICALGILPGCGGGGGDSGGGDTATGTVTGTVTDQDGSPLEGALVSITDNSGRKTITDQSGPEGEFILTGIEAGTWPMTITLEGYATATLSVAVSGGQTTQVPEDQTVLYPESYGTVTGNVTDGATSNPLGEVTVDIGEITGATGDDGSYTISSIPAGEQTILAFKEGYLTYSGTVTVIADSTVSRHITLSPDKPEPEPGKGNVNGKVIDVNGSALEGVEVTGLAIGFPAATGPDGIYLLQNLAPGEMTLNYAKTGYVTASQSVTVKEDTTITAPDMRLNATPQVEGTEWISRRVNLPEIGNAENPHINGDGSRVVFNSDGNVVTDWNSPSNTSQVYLWQRDYGTITRLSNNNLSPGSSAGANKGSTEPSISGDGKVAVFHSKSTDILPAGGSSVNNGDIFYMDISSLDDLVPTRISNNSTNPSQGGNGESNSADLNYDGSGVVFASRATDIGNISHTPGYRHIYHTAITRSEDKITAGARIMLDSHNSVEGHNSGASGPDPDSGKPRIARDGRYVVFHSRADTDIMTSPPATAGNGTLYVYRCDMNASPSEGRNIMVSKHEGGEPVAGSWNQCAVIRADGKAIAFHSNSPFNSGDDKFDVYLWSEGQSALQYMSQPLAGTKGISFRPTMSYDGSILGFTSNTQGLTTLTTYDNAYCYIKDLTSGKNEYILASVGASGQIPNEDCWFPILSGDGNYMVFQTESTNMTSDSYTTGTIDIFIRSWK